MNTSMNDVWANVLRIVNSSTNKITADDLTEEDNEYLDQLTDAVMHYYNIQLPTLEYAMNQALASHYVKHHTDDVITFVNVRPADMGVDVVHPLSDLFDHRWTNLWTIENQTLSCKNVELRCHIRYSSLQSMFDISDIEMKNMKVKSNSVYHGQIFRTPSIPNVISNSCLNFSVSELCEIMKQLTVELVKSDRWFNDYFNTLHQTMSELGKTSASSTD